MAYFFDFDASHRILRVRFEGRVTDQEFQEYYSIGGYHVARLQPVATISDFTGVTELKVSAQTVRNLARSYTAMPGDNPRLIIAPSPHIYGLARMFQVEGEVSRPNLHVFATAAEAYDVLKVHDPQFEPIS